MDAGTQHTLRVERHLQASHDPLIGKLLKRGLKPHLQLFEGGSGGGCERNVNKN